MNDSLVRRPRAAQPLFEGAEWDFPLMHEVYEAVKDVALNDLGLDVFPNQIEIAWAASLVLVVASSTHFTVGGTNGKRTTTSLVGARSVT